MIVIVDLDGTICFDGVKISDELIKALKNLENRHQIIFSSARPIRDMLPLLSDFPRNFLIGGNGSIVRNHGKIQVIKAFSNEQIEGLKMLINQQNLDYLMDSDWNYALRNRNDEQANINNKIDAANLAENVDLSNLTSIIKCNLLNLTDYSLLQKLQDLDFEIVKHEGTKSLDLTVKNVNKYTTFRQFFPSEKYIAFGNDENDIELLKHAKKSIVVGKISISADVKISKKELLQEIIKL